MAVIVDLDPARRRDAQRRARRRGATCSRRVDALRRHLETQFGEDCVVLGPSGRPGARRSRSPRTMRRHPAEPRRHPRPPPRRHRRARRGAARRRARGRRGARPRRPERRGAPYPELARALREQRRAAEGAGRARPARPAASRSSPPRAAAARRRSPPTSPPRWPTAAGARSAWSTSTSPSATSRSPCSCSRRTRSPTPSRSATSLDAPGASLSLLTPHSPGLTHSGRPGRAGHGRVDPGRRWSPRSSTCSSEQFDYVVVDTPPAFDDHVLAAFDQQRRHRPARHARHPGAEEPQAHARDPRPAQLPARALAASSSTAPTPRSGWRSSEVEKTLKAPIAAQIPSLARRPGLDQPRRADRPRRPEAPGEPGHQGASPSGYVAAGPRRPSDVQPASCAPTGAACCAGGRGPHEPRRPARRRPTRDAASTRRAEPQQRRRSASGAARTPRRSTRSPSSSARCTRRCSTASARKLYDARLTQAELEQKVRSTLQEVLAQEETPLTVADRARIAQEIADDILGYGPIEPFLRDPDVTEVMVNGPDSIYIERGGQHLPGRRAASPTRRTCAARSTRSSAGSAAASTSRSPMVDARLPDGSRVNAVIPPLALDGSHADHPQVRRRPATRPTT